METLVTRASLRGNQVDYLDYPRDYVRVQTFVGVVGTRDLERGSRGLSKILEDIFSLRGEKQLARSEYRPRIRRKEEEEDGRRRREEEEGTYLVLAAKEGGWKVNYLWKEG